MNVSCHNGRQYFLEAYVVTERVFIYGYVQDVSNGAEMFRVLLSPIDGRLVDRLCDLVVAERWCG